MIDLPPKRPPIELPSRALATTDAPIVGVAMMDATEARTTIETIKGHLDHARRLLLDLEEREGWRALGYASWRDCAQAEFGQSQAYLYRQLAAAKIERAIDSPIGEIPESHLRPLIKAKVNTQETIKRALDRADELAGDQPRTAKHVAQAAAEIARPDLPAEFAIAKRRLEALGHALSEAWDGHTQRFVVRKDGGTGVVMTWPDVVSKLARLEATPQDAPDHGASDSAAAYHAKEVCDHERLRDAGELARAGQYDNARAVLHGIEVATYARDTLLTEIDALEAAHAQRARSIGRQITIAFTADECAALLKDAKAFEASGSTRAYPALAHALILLVQGIRGAK